MLDLNTIKITVELSLIDYIVKEFNNCDYVSFILHDDTILDISISDKHVASYNNISEMVDAIDIDITISEDFQEINDKILEKYFKLYCMQ